MTFLEKVNRAADEAQLTIKNTIAVNGYRLLAHTIVEHGSLKLPHGSLAILSQVTKERIGHAIPTGSLRWYKTTMLRDMDTVDQAVGLPEAFKTLVRTGQAA